MTVAFHVYASVPVNAAAETAVRRPIREPGFDLSVNRMDKDERDRILKEVGGHVAAAVAGRLDGPAQSSGQRQPHPVVVSGPRRPVSDRP